MKLNTELSHEAEYLGDVQENRVGIDKSNLDFITTLLTSNLYSKPLESFFRETVSNAYDSHVEAGTEEHILLLIEDVGEEYNTYRISIRDYGVGLSPERFDKIYRNVGSSTKRESNDYIGMFGIGRFSCLSCADIANITSYYHGTKYSYLMYKNGGGINIDKISEVEGDYKDGLEVSIKKSVFSHSNWREAINSLCLFDKLHITYKGENYFLKGLVQDFNDRKVVNFKTFSWCSILGAYNNYFKVGRVIYNIESDKISINSRTGLIIDLPIGSVDITPNREALQYTDYTNKEIDLRAQKVKEELQTLIESKLQNDITLIKFCNDFVYNTTYLYTVLDSPVRFLSISPDDVDLDFSKIHINSNTLPNKYTDFLKAIRWFGIDKPIIYKNMKPGGGRNYSDKDMRTILTGRIDLATKEDNITKQVTLRYFQENLTKTTIVLTYSGLDELKDGLKKYCIKVEYMDKDYCEECINFTFNNLQMPSLSNDKVPASYIKDFQEEQRGKRKRNFDSTNIPIRKYGEFGYSMYYLNNLSRDGFVLYTAHTREDDTLKDLAALLTYYEDYNAVITIKSEHLHLLENNRRFIKVDDFMFLRNNVLSKLITCYVISKNFEGLNRVPLVREFNSVYKKQIYTLQYGKKGDTFLNLVSYYKEKKWLNYADIKYFSLSNYELEALDKWQQLHEERNNIIQMLTYHKYGRLQKIGLVPVKAPKIIKDYENIQKTKVSSD